MVPNEYPNFRYGSNVTNVILDVVKEELLPSTNRITNQVFSIKPKRKWSSSLSIRLMMT